MLIYLYGPDSYRRQVKLKEIVAAYRKKHSGLSIENFDLAEEGELAELKLFAGSQSLFDTTKLGVVVGIDNESKETAAFLKSLLESKSVSLVIESDKKLGRLFSFLENKPALSQEFIKLEGMSLTAWIKNEAAVRGVRLTSEDLDSLIRSNDGNTWGIINDLEKISLGGAPEYVEEIPQFWSLLGTIKGSAPAIKKIAALTWLLEQEDAGMIFNVLASQAGGEMKNKMADLDPAIKLGKIGYEEALLETVI